MAFFFRKEARREIRNGETDKNGCKAKGEQKGNPSKSEGSNGFSQMSSSHTGSVRAKRVMNEFHDLTLRCNNRSIAVELVEENLFEWNVKLYTIDQDSLLYGDMVETGTEFILLNITFPVDFPFAPPFMRVLAPRIKGGFVLDGGAICMELLTLKGWSSACTVEAIVVQFSAALVKGQGAKGQGRIVKSTKKDFSKKEAESAFKKLVKSHEKYGWATPPKSDG